MSRSLWDSTASHLLQRASSGDPTPGGGAIAAVTGAFGMGLVRMALEVTISRPAADATDTAALAAAQNRACELQAGLVEAADRDVSEFEALMAGYRMPHATDAERGARRHAIDEATVTATDGPLSLAEAAIAGSALADEIEPLVKRTIVSDVQAGRDLLRAAALAALRTADINLAALEEGGHPAAAELRRRRDAVHRAGRPGRGD